MTTELSATGFVFAIAKTAVKPPRLDGKTVVDGILDEPQWSQAALLTGFSQYTPVDGVPAGDSTEVMVWYSATALHIGIRAYDASGQVHATLQVVCQWPRQGTIGTRL